MLVLSFVNNIVLSGRGRLVQWKNVRFVKFRPRGPQFETCRRRFLFRCFTHHISDGRFNIGQVNQLTQPRSEGLLPTKLLLYEEERSLGNWSYDVTA